MIRLALRDEEDLRWWANDWGAGEMGYRSGQAAVESALAYGARVSGTRSAQDLPAEKALKAAERERRLAKRLQPLGSDERLLLREAFRVRDVRGLTAYGTFPGAVFACREVFARAKAAGVTRLELLDSWLREVAGKAVAPKGKQKAWAQAQVAAMAAAAERDLVAALLAFGARVEGVELPRSVPVAQLAQAMGHHPDTVWREAERREVGRTRTGRKRVLWLRDLSLKWPEAAQAIGC